MPNKNEWFETIQPLHGDEMSIHTEHIMQRVQEQLSNDTTERKPTMKKTTITRRIRNVFLGIAAVACIGTASMVTANALTDGVFFAKITAYVNGEEVELSNVYTDEENIVYETSDENLNIEVDAEGNAIVEYANNNGDVPEDNDVEVIIEYGE